MPLNLFCRMHVGARIVYRGSSAAVLFLSYFTSSFSSWTDVLDHGSIQGYPSYAQAQELLSDFVRDNEGLLVKQ